MMCNNVAPARAERSHRQKYEIVERLGAGGSGVVYKARDLEWNRWVALKLLAPHLRCDPIARACLANEARIGSTLEHPNLCTVYDLQTTEAGDLVVVMPYYEGTTLKRRLQRGALPICEAMTLAAQIADGLAYLHERSIAHGDLKPSNVIVTRGEIRILDFGLARFLKTRRGVCRAATMPGTAAYMAPEQTRGRYADPRTDMWALGVMLFEMLTGRAPFSGPYAEAVAYAIRHQAPPPMSHFRIAIPASLERVVQTLLEKNRNRRSGCAAAVSSELRTLTSGRTLTEVPPEFEVAA